MITAPHVEKILYGRHCRRWRIKHRAYKKYALEEAMGIGKAHGSIRSYEEKERRVIGTETVTEPEYGHYQIQ